MLAFVALASVVACSSPSATSTSDESGAAQPDPITPSADGGTPDPVNPGDPGDLDLSDVSVLFPLSTTENRMWKASDEAAYGALLPPAILAKLPPLLPTRGGPPGSLDTLRVVAMRLDPCFPSIALAPDGCRAQVRLVLQLVSDGAKVSAEDAAVHVFYELPTSELDALVAQLLDLKKQAGVNSTRKPLGVHPALAAETNGGPFTDGLRKAVFARIGAARLVRVTTMSVVQAGFQWRFEGFEVSDAAKGTTSPIDIAKAGIASQEFVGSRPETILPAAATDDDIHGLFVGADGVRPAQADLDSGARAALRIENPKTRDVETTSCASCHAAGPALRRAENTFGVSVVDAPEAYQNADFDLSTPFAGTETNQIRAFGWFFTQPQVSARVVNDSAEVVSFLRARRKK
ncbi:hypothetical protein AKJ09_02637 [Labilithrix luteola]|uniref:Cytochrome c domain-containing protein n=1 Tax=Labilithrix luteola TaxID=1391654 RepID=A0A0K1PR15_9BACT|nr:hypothetical protein AKJ09_02637 [Labilithrix luteola]